MRIKINLKSDFNFQIPVEYRSILQAVIYNHLNEKEANWLHEKGFMHEKRNFKLFAFSVFLERAIFIEKTRFLEFPNTVSFYISSPVDWIIKQLAQNLLVSQKINLNDVKLKISNIYFENLSCESESILIRTLCPIEVHSTFSLANGKKRTHYYTPFDKDFSDLINSNLKKKWEVFYNQECKHEMKIKPIFKTNNNERIIYFNKGANKTLIKGWVGKFKIQGDPSFINFALETGLGSRNSQGFGMIERI